MLWWIARAWPGQLGKLLRPLAGAKLPIWFDPSAFCQFFILGRDIFIRTILLLSCEALFLNEAAKLNDLSLAACQIMLSIFGVLAFAIDGFAHAAEALVGEAIGQKNKAYADYRHPAHKLSCWYDGRIARNRFMAWKTSYSRFDDKPRPI